MSPPLLLASSCEGPIGELNALRARVLVLRDLARPHAAPAHSAA
jgi:hypothetical protein